MALRADGATVYQFEGGEPFLNTPAQIKDAMRRALAENKTRYAPSSGIPELRAAIAAKVRERNQIPAETEDVLVVNGGMQGLFGAFQSVVNPGEEVLLFSPYWTPIKDLVANCEAESIFVSTDEARTEGFAQTLARHRTRTLDDGVAQDSALFNQRRLDPDTMGRTRRHQLARRLLRQRTRRLS